MRLQSTNVTHGRTGDMIAIPSPCYTHKRTYVLRAVKSGSIET